MISLKTPDEIESIARAGAVIAALYDLMPAEVVPGRTTAELDRLAESFIRDHEGAEPAFKGLYGFPATLCTSVNHEVVHGIPSHRRKLLDGDIVSIDCGVKLEGFYADAAITLPVGEIPADEALLLEKTRAALARGIAEAKPGNRLYDISAAVQEVADDSGYGIVRDLVGHGIGRSPHEEPQVPNYGKPKRGTKLMAGLVIAIEPMVMTGKHTTKQLPDKWTVVTADGSRAAHFEHTVAVTATGPRVLTAL